MRCKQTTTILHIGVSAGYREAIVTSYVRVIKEYNGISWDAESLYAYSINSVKAFWKYTYVFGKISRACIMGVEYCVFGKFRFMTR